MFIPLLAVCLASASSFVTVSCEPTNAVARVGETVTFAVAVRDAQGALLPTGSVTAVLDNIGSMVLVSNRVDLAKGNPFRLSGKLDEPGFLRVRVLSPAIANPTPYNEGVVVASCAVDPSRFVQRFACPSDFDAFWTSSRERLAKEVPLDPQVSLDPAHKDDADFNWYHVSFATFGRRVYGHLIVPKDVPSGTRLPACVQVPGAGFGSWSNVAEGRKGWVTLFLSVFPWQLETDFEPNRAKYDRMNSDFRARKLDAGTRPDSTCYHVSGLARSREDYFYYSVILGADRAVDWLAQRPDVDPNRITYHGTSQGGAFGLFLMGLNRHIARGVVYVPALTGQHLREQGLEDTWPWFADAARANAAYFDTVNFAARVRCPIRFVAGLSDTLCPPTGVCAAFNACPSSDKDIVFGVGMSHNVNGWIYERLAAWETAPRLSFDSTSVLVDGKRTYLVSGEFHYFRVPQADWRRRMRLFKDVGGNCLATYIPWIVHEPEEGKIVFGDQPARDLDLFLKTAKEEGLMVIARPGPYQYSELANNGLPTWLVEKYPEILTKKADGSIVGKGSVDYNHPTFLAKARPYFRAVAKVLKPHLAANGGPVVLTQLDNELTGIHVWFGYQPTEAYYADCAKYLETLKGWLVEDGITGPYCHNSGGAGMTPSYKTCVDRLGKRDFLLGYDHYYGLFQNEREAPVPYYFFDALLACDVLRGWGYPPVGFEIQCGTIGDIPPILKEDLLAAHMLNLAAGMKGINYYVFTGGPNFPKTAGDPNMEMYDYQAPVGPDGTVRPTYEALREFGAFVKDHPEFLEAERLTSVRVGLEWQHAVPMAPFDYCFNRFGMFYALMQTDYAPEYFLLEGEIPLDGKPLVLAGVTSMSAEAQARVAAYVKKGGKLLVAPDFPRQDLAGKPCTILADAAPNAARIDKTWKTQFFAQGERVAKILAEFGAKPVVRSSNRNVFTTAYRLKDGRTGVFALNLRSGAQETVISLPTGDAAALRLAPMSVRYRILSPKTLKDRVRLSARRLEDERYSSEKVFLTEAQSGGWPGDTEGRTILALVLQQAALGEKPKHLDAILRALPAHLNAKGYMGPLREGVLDEQQLSGNGWMLRGLCAYMKHEKRPVLDVKPIIRSIAHNLFLPGRGKYATYPISPDSRGEKGAASGTVAETKVGWRLSSDIGCLFIGLDGLVEARQVLDDPSLDPVIEEMIARFLEIDLVGIRAQTHASLTALRALLRYDAKRFLLEVEKRFDLYVRHGMTDDFANFNWFGRTDTWTEPCAIADSYLVARQLFAATGRTVYRDYAEKFLAALCAHQRENGGFGLRKTFPQGTYREPVEHCDEATWCCTMRGGAALAAALR